MSHGARAGLAVALGIAAIGAIAAGLAMLCYVVWFHAAVVGLAIAAHVVARRVDPARTAHPRLVRLAAAAGRWTANVAFIWLFPVWAIGIGDMIAARRGQGHSRAIAEARAVRDAQVQIRRASGSYVTLECLANASRCPAGVTPAAPPRPALLEPDRGGYRFAFNGAPPAGADPQRLDAFAYVGVPTMPACAMEATGEMLVCTDSTGRLCMMTVSPGAAPPAAVHCPDACRDLNEPRPPPYPPESAASASTQGGVASPSSSR
jgi:hypothetical protein